MNILIVEDSKPVTLVISRVVKEAGHDCLFAANGEMALRLFRQRDVDMVFVDVELPGIDGYEVVREVRRSSPQTPVIMVSGHQKEESRRQALEAGANEFLNKPVPPSRLQQLLAQYLG